MPDIFILLVVHSSCNTAFVPSIVSPHLVWSCIWDTADLHEMPDFCRFHVGYHPLHQICSETDLWLEFDSLVLVVNACAETQRRSGDTSGNIHSKRASVP